MFSFEQLFCILINHLQINPTYIYILISFQILFFFCLDPHPFLVPKVMTSTDHSKQIHGISDFTIHFEGYSWFWSWLGPNPRVGLLKRFVQKGRIKYYPHVMKVWSHDKIIIEVIADASSWNVFDENFRNAAMYWPCTISTHHIIAIEKIKS